MILSMHQPSYFPWLGLLDKIRQSDVFLVMDEVQLSDSAYQHRNLLLSADGTPKFLTIPFVKKNYLQKPIKALEIASPQWRIQHLNFIRNTYRNHRHAAEIMPRVEEFYAAEYRLLADAVIASMRLALEFFGIRTRVILQSTVDYDHSLRRGDLVVALARALGARCYLSGPGARAYLDESVFTAHLALRYNNFEHPVYPQRGSKQFQAGLASLDALYNLGPEASRTLLDGKRTAHEGRTHD
jgi:WbqC-like protein family